MRTHQWPAQTRTQARQTRAQFSNWLCYEASRACAAKPPPLPAGRAPGPAFEVIDPKEAELEKMLAGMKVRARLPCLPSQCMNAHKVRLGSPMVNVREHLKGEREDVRPPDMLPRSHRTQS